MTIAETTPEVEIGECPECGHGITSAIMPESQRLALSLVLLLINSTMMDYTIEYGTVYPDEVKENFKARLDRLATEALQASQEMESFGEAYEPDDEEEED